jgi:peptidoglycan L-alanyl-D-glutamate endopeptidase CwlK
MASRSLFDLHPAVRERAQKFTAQCDQQGITLLVTCTFRSSDEQAALFAQGRNPLAVVNTLRTHAGLGPIEESANKVVTKAKPGQSLHEYKCALDVVPLESGKCIWDGNHPIWRKVAAIGKSCGLEWAGDWVHMKEVAHFQYTGGLKLEDLRNGKIPV